LISDDWNPEMQSVQTIGAPLAAMADADEASFLGPVRTEGATS